VVVVHCTLLLRTVAFLCLDIHTAPVGKGLHCFVEHVTVRNQLDDFFVG
jgi:hypothetical protein